MTHRQQIFAEVYALTGRAEGSAIAAGTSPASARTRAYRWLQKAEIQERIEELRDDAFQDLRGQITQDLRDAVMCGLLSNRGYRRGKRALRIMERLKIFEHADRVSKEVEELEARFGVPFEEILAAMGEAQFVADMAEAE